MFDQYQKKASKNFKTFTELSADQAQLLNWTVGLSGEAGEVSELVKHHVFGKEPMNKMELAKELGDVLWYLAAICTASDISLAAVADLNINKLEYRYGGQGYDKEASALRHTSEKAFQNTFAYKRIEAAINHTPAPLNVIFVGPDGSGKTTISKKVAEKLMDEGFAYHKCDYRQENKPELAAQLASMPGQIFDRFYYPDDIIYTRVVWEREHQGEVMDWNTDYWRSYNKVLDTLCSGNTLIFYVDASDEVLKKRAEQWADDYVKVDEIQKIKALYRRWLSFIGTLPIIAVNIDTTEASVDECVANCLTSIKKAQAVFSDQDPEAYLSEEDKAKEAESSETSET